jgi:hypothetical protein
MSFTSVTRRPRDNGVGNDFSSFPTRLVRPHADHQLTVKRAARKESETGHACLAYHFDLFSFRDRNRPISPQQPDPER